MAKTVPVYVSVNADNNTLTAQPTTEPGDGLVEMWVMPESLEYVTRYWSKYLVVDGQFKRTVDSLPDLSIDHAQHRIEVLTAQLQDANSEIAANKKAADTADTANNTKINATNEKVTLHDEAILELSDMLLSSTTPASTTTGGEA